MNLLFEKVLCAALIFFLALWIIDIFTANDILSYEHRYVTAGLLAALAGSFFISIRNFWDLRLDILTAKTLSRRSIMVGIALFIYLGMLVSHTEETLNPSGATKGLMALVLFLILSGSLGIVIERIRAKHR